MTIFHKEDFHYKILKPTSYQQSSVPAALGHGPGFCSCKNEIRGDTETI